MIVSRDKAEGYQGIWFTLGQFSRYGDKYSGGLGTYTAKHVPLAVYAPQVKRTFFVYGGALDEQRHLLAMIGCYDHASGRVCRPTIVHDKGGVDDPHDNPSICLDEHGHIWVFVSGRGRKRPGYKYRSLDPFDISAFEQVAEEEMTYPQPWWIAGAGFVHLFTKYTGVRELYWNTSANDGREWTPHGKLAGMGGHYQISCQQGRRIATAFNMHPGGNVDKRTNLYYLYSDDLGQSWRTAAGATVETPLTEPDCSALVRDFAAEERLVYMKDIRLDAAGNPIILVLTSAHYEPGPGGDPRWWTVARWDGAQWNCSHVAQSTHNYDMGSLYLESEDDWAVIAPTEAGPQLHGTGGEMALWRSRDQGTTWTRERQITRHSARNHAYARRPVDAQPDFYAFWADGNPDEFSPSRLYYTDRQGSQVWALPVRLEGDWVRPDPLY